MAPCAACSAEQHAPSGQLAGRCDEDYAPPFSARRQHRELPHHVLSRSILTLDRSQEALLQKLLGYVSPSEPFRLLAQYWVVVSGEHDDLKIGIQIPCENRQLESVEGTEANLCEEHVEGLPQQHSPCFLVCAAGGHQVASQPQHSADAGAPLRPVIDEQDSVRCVTSSMDHGGAL